MAVSICIHTYISQHKRHIMENSPIPVLRSASIRYQMLGMSYPAASLLTKLATRRACNRSIFPPFVPPFVAFQCGVRGAVVRVSIRPRLGSAAPASRLSLGAASRIQCRKLSRSLHLSWTCLSGFLLLSPKYHTKHGKITRFCWSFC